MLSYLFSTNNRLPSEVVTPPLALTRSTAQTKLVLNRYDSKGQSEEALTSLRSAIDAGAQYIFQGNSSANASALIDAIQKHNDREPNKRVVFLNYAAVDPALTQEKCNFWHFRFDAHADMRMTALMQVLKQDNKLKSVYLIGQDYSFGQAVLREAKQQLTSLRPDIQISGDELHPMGRVKDFLPYASKIKASGADSVITGNWGSDLALLVKAANEAGYSGKFFTYYTGVTGTPTALGQGAAGRVYQVSYAHYNMGGVMAKHMAGFRAKYNDDLYTGSMVSIFDVLTLAMAQAKSTDPVKVAAAMHGLKFKGFNGDMEMRKLDHQLQQTLYMTVWQKVDKKFPYSAENTGMTLLPVKEFPSYISSTPTSCQMKRPG